MSTTDVHAEHTIAEHESVAEHGTDQHTHGADCGHETVDHEGQSEYVHDGHKHAVHGDHYDEH